MHSGKSENQGSCVAFSFLFSAFRSSQPGLLCPRSFCRATYSSSALDSCFFFPSLPSGALRLTARPPSSLRGSHALRAQPSDCQAAWSNVVFSSVFFFSVVFRHRLNWKYIVHSLSNLGKETRATSSRFKLLPAVKRQRTN